MGRLEGKVAFITGVARGQGRAHAVRFAREGAAVIGIDICEQIEKGYPGATPEDLDETVRLVTEAGGEIVAEQGDVRRLGDLEEAVAKGVDRFGHLDVVVANAGIFSFGWLWEITEQQWQEMIDVNLTGVFHTIKATVPTLIEQGSGGSFIIVSSVAGLRGVPFAGHYAAAKHGIVGLCRTLANELGQHRIRVNSIHPASVNTPISTDPRLFELILEHSETLAPIYMNSLPYHTMEPESVSELVTYLASDESMYTTGAQIPIDMGTLSR
jgi:SDR family mycofactocin-dependent oxidoreductase